MSVHVGLSAVEPPVVPASDSGVWHQADELEHVDASGGLEGCRVGEMGS